MHNDDYILADEDDILTDEDGEPLNLSVSTLITLADPDSRIIAAKMSLKEYAQIHDTSLKDALEFFEHINTCEYHKALVIQQLEDGDWDCACPDCGNPVLTVVGSDHYQAWMDVAKRNLRRRNM